MSNYLIPILLIVAIIGIGGFIWWKKRKEKGGAAQVISAHKNKDEVWKAVKQYLKDSGDFGKEITDCYVVKRNNADFINPNWSPEMKKNKRNEIKLRRLQLANKKKEMKKLGQKMTIPKEKDLYVVVFTTRDIKTRALDAPRAIECEVINVKKGKKDFERKILINGLLDHDKEMEWIAPLREKERPLSEKQLKLQAKQDEKRKKLLEKKKLHAQKIAEKNARKTYEGK